MSSATVQDNPWKLIVFNAEEVDCSFLLAPFGDSVRFSTEVSEDRVTYVIDSPAWENGHIQELQNQLKQASVARACAVVLIDGEDHEVWLQEEFDEWLGRHRTDIDRIRSEFEQGKIVPFVGAGMSVTCGMSPWGAFLGELARRHGISNAVSRLLDDGNFEGAADLVAERTGRVGLVNEVARVFGEQVDDVSLAGPITMLPRLLAEGTVVTTNFDRVLEAAYRQANIEYQAVIGLDPDRLRLERGGPNTGPINLFKVHGDATGHEQVLSSSDYDSKYGAKSLEDGLDPEAPFTRALISLFENRRLFFLGCSLGTDRTLNVLSWCSHRPGANFQHFALVHQDVNDYEQLSRLVRCGITPLIYPPNHHNFVEKTLRILLSEEDPDDDEGEPQEPDENQILQDAFQRLAPNSRFLGTIELERSFADFASLEAELEDSEVDDPEQLLERFQFHLRWHRSEHRRTWSDLSDVQRLVVLGEAGTGKSTELARQAHADQQSGKCAFFVDIISLAEQGLEGALRPLELEAFELWKSSSVPCVFYLDALDEARLQRMTLQQALRRLEVDVTHAAWPRVQLVISCRVSDWRARTDRNTVEAFSTGVEKVLVVGLTPLDEQQVRDVATHVGVQDSDVFIRRMRERYLQGFSERPRDVVWLANYWSSHHDFGRFEELMDFNVSSKLRESEDRPQELMVRRARKGAEHIAGVALLNRCHSIALIGDEQSRGLSGCLDAEDVLSDWERAEIGGLLRLPLFDEATYGRVRIHHRSVSEYLAACWFLALRDEGMPFEVLQGIFFPNDASGLAIPPRLEPVAAWLCLWDDELRSEVVQRSPQSLLFHGDPSGLSVSVREEVLRGYARRYESECRQRLMHSFDLVMFQRFSSPDLALCIRELLDASPEELIRHLILMVQGGQIEMLAEDVLGIALSKERTIGTRQYAVRCLIQLNVQSVLNDLRQVLDERQPDWSKEFVGLLLDALYPDMLELNEVVELCFRIPLSEAHVLSSIDTVARAGEISCRGSLNNQILLVEALLNGLVGYDERNIPPNHEWVGSLVVGVFKKWLGEVESLNELSERQFGLFCVGHSIVCEQLYCSGEFSRKFLNVFTEHRNMRRDWFWMRVGSFREKEGRCPVQANSVLQRYRDGFELEFRDVQWLFEDALTREHPGEKVLAFDGLLRAVPRDDSALRLKSELISRALASEPMFEVRYERFRRKGTFRDELQERVLYRRNARHRLLEWKFDKEREEARQDFESRISQIRTGEDFDALLHFANEVGFLNRGDLDLSRIEELYGEPVRRAAEDGFKLFWRQYVPLSPANLERGDNWKCEIPYCALVGRIGLEIESQEDGFPGSLSEDEVRAVLSHALWYSDSSPLWLSRFREQFPELLLDEWRVEVQNEFCLPDLGEGDSPWHGFLYRLVYSSDESLKSMFVPLVVEQIRQGNPSRSDVLIQAIQLVKDVTSLAPLFDERCRLETRRDVWSAWWRAWVLHNPLDAIEYLEEVLGQDEVPANRMMLLCSSYDTFITQDVSELGQAQGNSEALRRLVLLAYQQLPTDTPLQVGVVNWINDSNKATSFKRSLVNALAEVPGQETASALRWLAEQPALVDERDRLLSLAERREQADVGEQLQFLTQRLLAELSRNGTNLSAIRWDRLN